MTPVPKIKQLIDLLLIPGIQFKTSAFDYDISEFVSKEDIEIYIGEQFLSGIHSKIIKTFDNENVTIIFHWKDEKRTGLTLKIKDTLKMSISTIHYLIQMEEDLILYKDET